MIELLDSLIERNSLPADGEVLSYDGAMSLAIDIANQGLGSVAPNPLVGAVIVDDSNRFVCAGYHAKYGEQHAEAAAIAAFKTKNSKASRYKMFVSLEPCSHQGSQPPCVDTILSNPTITEVYFAAHDPNPEVRGDGQEFLRKAGVLCEQLEGFEERERKQNRVFYHQCSYKRPFVALKVATDHGGFIAAYGDKRRNITNERARKYSHFIRAQYGAVVIGSDTLKLDDPALDTRFFYSGKIAPFKVVIASGHSLETIDRSLKLLRDRQLLIVTDEGFEPADLGLAKDRFIFLQRRNGNFCVQDILSELYARGITSVMIEGGARTYKDFLDAKIVDYVHLFTASIRIEADSKIYWYQGKNDLFFKDKSCIAIGSDQVLETFVAYS